jgi:RNA polymerase sigma factor (sigma-70 family)
VPDARRQFTPIRPEAGADLPAPRREDRLALSRPAGAWVRFGVDATGQQFRLRARVDAQAAITLEVEGAAEPAVPPVEDIESRRRTGWKRRLEQLTPDQWALVGDHQAAAYRMAARYTSIYPSYAPFIEDAALDGLVTAVLKWDESRGVRFTTWAALCVRSVIGREVARERKRRADLRRAWVRAQAGATAGASRNGEPLLSSCRRAPELHPDIDRLLAPLRGIRRRLLRLVYVDGYSMDEAAAIIGRSHSGVYVLARFALRELVQIWRDIDPGRTAAV